MTTKKNTRGGTRQGSGAKPKYKEQTKTVLRKREYDSKLYQLTLKLSKMSKLEFYGGNGIKGISEQGHFQIISDVKPYVIEFDMLSDAVEYYDGLMCEKALWDITGIPELLECHVIKKNN